DTVGFIRHLPHKLVEAFQATLQEAAEATLLIHVIDAADPDRELNVAEVESVLAEIGADDVPSLRVMNKIDLLDSAPRIERDDHGLPEVVWLSAQQGLGLDLLDQALSERLAEDVIETHLTLLPRQGRLRAGLHELGAVREEAFDDQGHILLDIRLPRRDFMQLLARLGEKAEDYLSPEDRESPVWADEARR
ncbi:MAG: GTPase HflX, partial [Halomonas sp.]|nr:GTPase HflX [Halomonas sp.]